jgi:putative membrane protein
MTLSAASAPYTLVGNISNNFASAMAEASKYYAYVNIAGYISSNTIGNEFNFYGIGLGEYFICIGLFVGTLSQVVVYDKKKRVKKLKAPKWYFSKSLMMACTSILQATILALAICAMG